MIMRIPSRRLVSFSSLGLVVLALGACIIPGTVGDDPDPGDDATATSGATDTDSPGFTSAEPSGTGSASGVSAGVTTEFPNTDSGMATGGPLDPDEALEACGVPVVDTPGGVYEEFIECSGGCVIDIHADEPPNLFEYGECLCAVMDCGEFIGGGGTGPAPTTGEDTDTGEPDGCGPFPPGAETFTCTCEICSIDVNDVDGDWLANEADLEGICACMCGNTGCGMPV